MTDEPIDLAPTQRRKRWLGRASFIGLAMALVFVGGFLVVRSQNAQAYLRQELERSRYELQRSQAAMLSDATQAIGAEPKNRYDRVAGISLANQTPANMSANLATNGNSQANYGTAPSPVTGSLPRSGAQAYYYPVPPQQVLTPPPFTNTQVTAYSSPEELKASESARNLLNQMRQSPQQRTELMPELKSAIGKLFDLRHQEQAQQIEKLEEQLKKAKDLHAKRAENRDEVIDRRIASLLGDRDDLDWNRGVVESPSGSSGPYSTAPGQYGYNAGGYGPPVLPYANQAMQNVPVYLAPGAEPGTYATRPINPNLPGDSTQQYRLQWGQPSDQWSAPPPQFNSQNPTRLLPPSGTSNTQLPRAQRQKFNPEIESLSPPSAQPPEPADAKALPSIVPNVAIPNLPLPADPSAPALQTVAPELSPENE